MNWRDARPAVLIAVTAVALVASFHDSASPPTAEPPPNIRIFTPDTADALVHEPTFEIGGDFAGSATVITVAVDGVEVGEATRGDVAFDWRFAAGRFSVTPGIHEITAVATGEGGPSRPASLWVLYEPDPSITFAIAIMPASATYAPGEDEDDPQVHLFGPPDGVDLTLTTESPPTIDAHITPMLSTGADTRLRIDLGAPPPGTYPVVLRGVGPSGETHEATHTITITGPPPVTDPPVTTDAPTATEPAPTATGAPTAVVLSDDFEGPDRWSTTVTASTNGSRAAVETAGGGNPGSYRRMTHVMPPSDDGQNNPTQLAVLHTYLGGGWDPATDGPLDRVDYAEDQIEFDPPFEGAAIGTRFAVVQDGTTYLAPTNEGNAFTNLTWQTIRVTGLTPADFTPAPGPDFSATGGPLTFGFARSNTSRNEGTGLTTQHGIDNWTVTLHPAP